MATSDRSYIKPASLAAVAEYGNADAIARWLAQWWLDPTQREDHVLVAIRNAAGIEAAGRLLREQYVTNARKRGVPESEIEAALQPERERDHGE